MAEKRKVTAEEIEDYTFTERQKKAYEELKKAIAKCEAVGLYLLGKSDGLQAYPKEFQKMVNVRDGVTRVSDIVCPHLTGARISDCGADDSEFFLKEFVAK